jgi:hypothetical protein
VSGPSGSQGSRRCYLNCRRCRPLSCVPRAGCVPPMSPPPFLFYFNSVRPPITVRPTKCDRSHDLLNRDQTCLTRLKQRYFANIPRPHPVQSARSPPKKEVFTQCTSTPYFSLQPPTFPTRQIIRSCNAPFLMYIHFTSSPALMTSRVMLHSASVLL